MREEPASGRQFVVIGGGPAGLTAAYELTKLSLRPIVLEKSETVGGLARTESYKGFYFDMGGHRFFTKIEEVKKMWHEILEDDFLRRPRLSRIYYNHRMFYYPLRPLNALAGLGFWQSASVVLSYLQAQLFPYRREETFEHWVTNRFGRRLFRIFFKAYTEKVWGISCADLKAEWAAQRIKDLSLRTALLTMFVKPRRPIKTLIAEFDYPRLGPGMLWNAVKTEIERRHGTVRLGWEVVRLRRSGHRIESVVVGCDGREEIVHGTDFISSMPLTALVGRLDPPPGPAVLRAAERLTYRDFLTVCLIVNRPDLFPDNWIYVHDPDVRVARIQNFKNWSPDMVPDPAKSSLGLEYFCKEGDELWGMPDAELVEMAKREVERIALARYTDVEDGCVFRVAKAYPVYDTAYREHLATVREFVDSLENLQTIGRNGLHRYNNQDHAMVTGMLAVRNLVAGERHDLWAVNTDQEYHEEIRAKTPIDERQLSELAETALSRVFRRLDSVALGLAVGSVVGMLLLLATLILVVKGGPHVGRTLQLLSQYFPGYRVSVAGSGVGFAYAFVVGYLGGWTFASVRNATVRFYMALVRRRVERRGLQKLLD